MFQILELPTETDRLHTYQALLVTKRVIFLDYVYNSSSEVNSTVFYEVSDCVALASLYNPGAGYIISIVRI